MPRTVPEHRARMCAFTYSDGRRCRLPRTVGLGYCYSHAAKIRKKREEEFVAELLAEPLAHSTITSTTLSFMLTRLFGLVAAGHVSPKTSNALLRVIDGLRKNLRNTTQEFLQCYDVQNLRTLVESLHDEHDDFLRLAGSQTFEGANSTAPDQTAALAANEGQSQAEAGDRPRLIPAQPPRPRPAVSPEELLKHLEQRLASR